MPIATSILNDMNIWKTISSLLNNGQQLYLLTVIESIGSAPGRRGFKMVVSEDTSLYGSIGGGIMEFNLVEKARNLLASNTQQSFIIEQTHHGRSRSSSGMICSGSQIVAFIPIHVKDKDTVKACENDTKMIHLCPKGIKIVDLDTPQITAITSDENWSYTELLNSRLCLHLFGAGHVSLPTSELLVKLGFNVHLYDNRTALNTFIENQFVQSKQIIDYDNIHQQIEMSDQDYVVLMTNKFTEDKLLLSQVLGRPYRYIGVLGSSNKIKVMFEALKKAGHLQNDLDQISAPIGVAINSRTVEEIAISIAAEIIKVKNMSGI